jgi:hypothetical protein
MKNLLCLCLALSAFQFSMAQAKEGAAVKPVYFDSPAVLFAAACGLQ